MRPSLGSRIMRRTPSICQSVFAYDFLKITKSYELLI